ncbi:MAG TPA: Dyp-type peroxidase [Dongiaceae bacterium]|nr:Dyp-type peroxidase [Dongiaceae bacterium]
MASHQPGILAPLPPAARYLTFIHKLDTDPRPVLQMLAQQAEGDRILAGFGPSLVQLLGAKVLGLHEMPALSGAAVEVPSTPASLWLWLRGDDRGELVNLSRKLRSLLAPAFELRDAVDGFTHRHNRDLSGYEDGTENPKDEEALVAAIVQNERPGYEGSSFVAVQQWLHNLNHFESLAQKERDYIMGRRQSDNEELENAPESAHVKRSAQEDFTPPAFMFRRSMPWNDATRDGLMFVAFGHTLQAFEAIMRRMVGLDDGITDGLFRYTRPLNGAYFWCPPLKDGKLDLSLLKL